MHTCILHMAQLMPLPLTVSCFSEIQTDFTFLVPAHPGSPGQRAVKRVCVCGITFNTSHVNAKLTDLEYGLSRADGNPLQAWLVLMCIVSTVIDG